MLAKQDVSDAIDALFLEDEKEVATIEPIIGKDVSALAFESNKVFYGTLRFGKTARNLSAEFVAKLGLTSGEGQVTQSTTSLKWNGENNTTLQSVLISSTTSKNAYAILDGYEITLQATS